MTIAEIKDALRNLAIWDTELREAFKLSEDATRAWHELQAKAARALMPMAKKLGADRNIAAVGARGHTLWLKETTPKGNPTSYSFSTGAMRAELERLLGAAAMEFDGISPEGKPPKAER
jgi:hypothetical protein